MGKIADILYGMNVTSRRIFDSLKAEFGENSIGKECRNEDGELEFDDLLSHGEMLKALMDDSKKRVDSILTIRYGNVAAHLLTVDDRYIVQIYKYNFKFNVDMSRDELIARIKATFKKVIVETAHDKKDGAK